MAVTSFWQQTLTYPAASVRRLAALFWPGRDGVRYEAGSPLLVQAQTTPNMTVRVNPGWAKKSNYIGQNDAVTNVTIATANASNPRIDLIVMRWRDTEVGDAASSVTIEAITGTPAATPSAPSTAGMIVQILAQVAVAAGTTSIAGSAVTDVRSLVMQDGRATWQYSRASTITLANGALVNALTLTTKDVDVENWGLSGGGLQVPYDGIYQVSGKIEFATGANARRGVWVSLDGTAIPATYTLHYPASATPRVPSGTGVVQASAGQLITLGAYQDSGGNLTANGLSLTVEKLA